MMCCHYLRNYTALQNLKVEYKCKGQVQILHEQPRKNLEGLGFDPGAVHSPFKYFVEGVYFILLCKYTGRWTYTASNMKL